MNKCLECDKDFEHLHHHLKSHGLSVEQYYRKHYPKFDLYDGEPIAFKDSAHYLSSYFNNRENMAGWFKVNTDKNALKVAIDSLEYRIKKKGLVFAPSHLELKTLLIPSVYWFEKNSAGYNKTCNSLGLKCKYDYFSLPDFVEKDGEVLIDTREQKPLLFKKSRILKLDCGDYYYTGTERLFFERKSLEDLVGTLSAGYERFNKELDRVTQYNNYVIVLCEIGLNNFLSLKSFNHSESSGIFIQSRIRELMQKYPCMQFLFVNGREECSRALLKIAGLNNFNQYDLQYLYDSGVI
jgi:hypothetical protein